MKLLSVEIDDISGSGSILNGLAVSLRRASRHRKPQFDPICLIGPNGAGKSQFLQALAEIFQSAWHACAPAEERHGGSASRAFTVEYLIWQDVGLPPTRVRVSRSAAEPAIVFETHADGEWVRRSPLDPLTRSLLPSRVIGYTSGENETLSVPFFTSRGPYSEEVRTRALPPQRGAKLTLETTGDPLEPRLMLIDYATHLQVLVANLLLGTPDQQRVLLDVAQLDSLRSVRCVIQLATRRASASVRRQARRKGIQLTDELEGYIENLKACSTCWDYEDEREVYTFDYWCDGETSAALASFFGSAFELYRALYKLGLLNDLAISRSARKRFDQDVTTQRFAARLPEPPDEDKVFRFEQVTFRAAGGSRTVDYVSLSDGEHQRVEILGVFAMIKERNVLFLLDEPESHFNPKWRVRFMSELRKVPTTVGTRASISDATAQEVLLTTHAPFVPSDMPQENVVIFERVDGKITARPPDIQTFGASFEEILEHCFRIDAPISDLARTAIDQLILSGDVARIEAAIPQLGASVEKVHLLDHLRRLKR